MEYYNKIAESYTKLHKKEQLEKVKIILKHIKPKGKLLDIGAGTGVSTRPFEKHCDCIALDPSEGMLSHYKGKKIIANAEKLPFPDNTFDTVISVTSLHHACLNKAIKEIKRVAKPDAQIAISFLKRSKHLKEIKFLLRDYRQIESKIDIIFIKKSD